LVPLFVTTYAQLAAPRGFGSARFRSLGIQRSFTSVSHFHGAKTKAGTVSGAIQIAIAVPTSTATHVVGCCLQKSMTGCSFKSCTGLGSGKNFFFKHSRIPLGATRSAMANAPAKKKADLKVGLYVWLSSMVST